MPSELDAAIEAAKREAMSRRDSAIEAEIARLLPGWPSELGEPCLIYGPRGEFQGIGPKGKVGEAAVVILPAQPIVLTVEATDAE